jgi:hypothetical protein
MGTKVGDEGSCGPASRDEYLKKISRERQMHNKEETKKHSHLMRFVDLTFFHLPW